MLGGTPKGSESVKGASEQYKDSYYSVICMCLLKSKTKNGSEAYLSGVTFDSTCFQISPEQFT